MKHIPTPILEVLSVGPKPYPTFMASLRWEVDGNEYGVAQEVATTHETIDKSVELAATQVAIDNFVKWCNERLAEAAAPIPDYDAAATAFQKHLDHQPFELMSAVCDTVDAALGEQR